MADTKKKSEAQKKDKKSEKKNGKDKEEDLVSVIKYLVILSASFVIQCGLERETRRVRILSKILCHVC